MEPYPEWNEMVFYRWGYARVKALDASTLEWEWVNGFDTQRYDKMKITQNLTFSDAGVDSWVLPADVDTSSTGGDDDDEDLSTGALVGIYLAGALAIAVVSVGLYVLISKQVTRENNDANDMNTGLVNNK